MPKLFDRVYFPVPCPEGYPPDQWVGPGFGEIYGRSETRGLWAVRLDEPVLVKGYTTHYIYAGSHQFEVVNDDR